MRRSLQFIIALLTLGVSLVLRHLLRRQFYRDRASTMAYLRKHRQLIETRLGTVEYKDTGGPGPVVLVVHGMLGSCYQGHRAARPLWDKPYRLIAISRPGYLGTTTAPDMGDDIREQAELYAAFLDAMNIERVILVSMSASGPSCITFIERYPQRVQALVLMGAVTQAVDYRKIHLTDSLIWLLRSINSDYTSWLIMHLLTALIPIIALFRPNFRQRVMRPEVVRDTYIEAIKSFFPISAFRRGLVYDLEQLRQLPTIAMDPIHLPTLIVHGAEDVTVPPEHGENAAEHIPNARLVLIHESAGHSFHLTHTEKVWEPIFDFLDDI